MKKHLSLLLAAVMLFSLCAAASAATVDAFEDWAAEPTADGGAYTLASCSSDAAVITVPDTLGGKPVTGIAPHAFMKNTSMQTLTVPESVTAIGAYAFVDCTALCQATLPASLAQLGEAAFSGCTQLTAVNLDTTQITEIMPYTFADTALTEAALPTYCTRIADNAFVNCAALQSVTIPRTVEEIGESAFSGCEQLTIRCEEGSAAEAFAAAHEIPYSCYHSVYPYLNGDADGDGIITVMDATRIQRVLARMTVEDAEENELRGDVDGDGLRIFDATAIQRFLAGMGNPYGIGETVYR